MTQHTPLAPIQLFDQPSGTYTYIVSDPTTREAIIIDPVEEQIERDMAILQEYKLTLRYAIETPCPRRSHHQRGKVGRAHWRQDGRARQLRHYDSVYSVGARRHLNRW